MGFWQKCEPALAQFLVNFASVSISWHRSQLKISLVATTATKYFLFLIGTKKIWNFCFHLNNFFISTKPETKTTFSNDFQLPFWLKNWFSLSRSDWYFNSFVFKCSCQFHGSFNRPQKLRYLRQRLFSYMKVSFLEPLDAQMSFRVVCVECDSFKPVFYHESLQWILFSLGLQTFSVNMSWEPRPDMTFYSILNCTS